MVVVAGNPGGFWIWKICMPTPTGTPRHRVHLRFQAHARAEEGQGDGGSGSRWRHIPGGRGLPPDPFNPPWD